MKVKQIMKKPVFVSPSTTKGELLNIVKKHPQTSIFIVANKDRKFLGDFHENDLFYMILPNESYEDIGVELAFDLEKKFFAKTAKQIMRKHDVSCYADEDVMNVAMRFAAEEENEMPVLDRKGKVIGVITQGIILRHLKLK